jgi:hypothetical protein
MQRVMRLAAAAWAAGLVGCAAMLDMQPAQLSAGAGAAPSSEIRIVQAANARPSSGFSSQLPAGSRWRAVGRVAQGGVYRRVDGVFNVEARNFHEAYLVIDGGGRLQGFYLPFEQAFSPAVPPTQLTLEGNP